MTGPSPDADLDNTLGINQLPPAVVTDEHLRLAAEAINTPLPQLRWQQVAQAIADAEQRGAARIIAERTTAGTHPQETR